MDNKVFAMTARVTLTIDAEVIDAAKKYAEENGRSLSAIVENYLKSLGVNAGGPRRSYSPAIQELLGSVPLSESADYKDVLGEEMAKKYLGL